MLKQCFYCKNEIKGNSKRTKYCSAECSKKQTSLNYSSATRISDKKRKCKFCKEDYTPKTANQKYCKRECQEKAYSIEYQVCGLDKKHWYKMRFEVFKRDNFTCQYCGRNVKEDKIKLQCDHIIPKSKGGKNSMNNLTTACLECNQGKSNNEL